MSKNSFSCGSAVKCAAAVVIVGDAGIRDNLAIGRDWQLCSIPSSQVTGGCNRPSRANRSCVSKAYVPEARTESNMILQAMDRDSARNEDKQVIGEQLVAELLLTGTGNPWR